MLKKHATEISPHKLIFSGNFTEDQRLFNITELRRNSMKQNILEEVIRKSNEKMGQGDENDDNTMYEDPRDVIGDWFYFHRCDVIYK